MKATELQIGDWVEITETVIKGNYQVQEIKRNDGLGVVVGRSYFMWGDFIQPIPLTPEILEKNGFKSNTFLSDEWEREVYFREFPGCVLEPNDDGKYTFGTICYWSEKDTDGSPIDWGTMYDSRINGVHYVHELQHALRLCGLTDMAENFKI